MPGNGRITDPNRHMGVYKRLTDVPSKDRLDAFTRAYAGRDVWAEYVETIRKTEDRSDRFWQDAARIGDRWNTHMDARGGHHALAAPAIADAWATALMADYSLRTAHEHYAAVSRFYEWLMTHTDHPHVYNPFWMAAAAYPDAARAWVGERKADAQFTLPTTAPTAGGDV